MKLLLKCSSDAFHLKETLYLTHFSACVNVCNSHWLWAYIFSYNVRVSLYKLNCSCVFKLKQKIQLKRQAGPRLLFTVNKYYLENVSCLIRIKISSSAMIRCCLWWVINIKCGECWCFKSVSHDTWNCLMLPLINMEKEHPVEATEAHYRSEQTCGHFRSYILGLLHGYKAAQTDVKWLCGDFSFTLKL